MEQLKFFQKENKKGICVFTGHRELGEDFSQEKLLRFIKKAINEGVETFLCGMAVGFDMLAAELVLEEKKENKKIRLVLYIPCYGQEKYYKEKDKKRYVEIVKKADESIYLSEKYYKGCMQVRDKKMAESADVMITYCKKEKGGTAYTVKCFKKKNPEGEILYL